METNAMERVLTPNVGPSFPSSAWERTSEKRSQAAQAQFEEIERKFKMRTKSRTEDQELDEEQD